MSFKEFIKPSKKKILFFIPIVVIFVLVFNSIKMFPCYTRPTLGPDQVVDWKLNDCSLRDFGYNPITRMTGVAVKETVLSVLMMIIMFLAIPYVLACSFSSIKKK